MSNDTLWPATKEGLAQTYPILNANLDGVNYLLSIVKDSTAQANSDVARAVERLKRKALAPATKAAKQIGKQVLTLADSAGMVPVAPLPPPPMNSTPIGGGSAAPVFRIAFDCNGPPYNPQVFAFPLSTTIGPSYVLFPGPPSTFGSWGEAFGFIQGKTDAFWAAYAATQCGGGGGGGGDGRCHAVAMIECGTGRTFYFDAVNGLDNLGTFTPPAFRWPNSPAFCGQDEANNWIKSQSAADTKKAIDYVQSICPDLGGGGGGGGDGGGGGGGDGGGGGSGGGDCCKTACPAPIINVNVEPTPVTLTCGDTIVNDDDGPPPPPPECCPLVVDLDRPGALAFGNYGQTWKDSYYRFLDIPDPASFQTFQDMYAAREAAAYDRIQAAGSGGNP